jgi:Sec-independent protein translocase protein TatA
VQLLTDVGTDVTKAKTSLATATQQMMPGGALPQPAVKTMTLEEYKTFVKNMDKKITEALKTVDQSIAQFRQKTKTKDSFLNNLKQAETILTSVENAFINAMPPQQMASGNVLVTEGVSYLSNGIKTMQTAVKNNDNELYKQAVQKFAAGIQKIQEGNVEYKKAL